MSAEQEEAADQRIAALLGAARNHRVPFQGRVVHWRCWGQGSPLVLLHGGHGSWLHWVRNVDALAARHAVWVPDLPGFGDSDALSDAHDFDGLLQATAATLDEVLGPATQVGLAGFSFGALVAAELADRRPGVRRLALIGPAGHGGVRRQPLAMVNWRRAATPVELETALRNNLASLMLADPGNIDALALRVQDQTNQATRFHSKPISRSMRLPQVLARLRVPLLLLWGEHDVTADPQAVAPNLLAGRSERYLRVVPGVGHWAQYEAADAVNGLLTEWFAEDVSPA